MRLSCVSVIAVLAFSNADVSHGEITRFATAAGAIAPTSAFYVDPYIQNYRFSGTTQGRSFVDVTLNSAAPNILYNQLTFWTSAAAVRTTTYNEIRPGTFQTVQTKATIIVDPVSISVSDIGTLALYQSISEFDIEPNVNGQHGGFSSIPLTGSYTVSRGSDTASGNFAISLPIYRNNQFPREYLYVNNYPNTISLKGVGSIEDIVQWMDWPEGQNNPTKKTIFHGILDGFEAVLELQGVYFSRASQITLSPMPQTNPGQIGDYSGDGKIDAGDYIVWRNNLVVPDKWSDDAMVRSRLGRIRGAPAGSAYGGVRFRRPASC